MRVGDINGEDRGAARGRTAGGKTAGKTANYQERARRSYRRYLVRLGVLAALVVALVAGAVAVYYSSLFTINQVSVTVVEHLTASAMTELASVPEGTTLLRVDASGIRSRLLAEAWVDDAQVNRVFPDTLEIVITEKTIAAVVSVPVDSAETTEDWAIASDGTWLMMIPSQSSEEAAEVSVKVYEDAENVLRITEVPVGVNPVVGEQCTDENVNNALNIVSGLTTELADQVKSVKATETVSTVLTLENGIEISFGEGGTTQEIREKERVILELMSEYPDSIAYINVRVVESPTWRSK